MVMFDERIVKALGAMFIAAIVTIGTGGNYYLFLVLAAMAILVTWDFGKKK